MIFLDIVCLCYTYMSLKLSFCLFCIYLSVCLSHYRPIYLCISLYVSLSICLLVFPVCLFVCVFVSICLLVTVSVNSAGSWCLIHSFTLLGYSGNK